MRRFVSVLFALATVAAVPVAAQSHPDLSGKWVLDASKSQGPMVPPSMELTVTQTDKLLTIERSATGPAGATKTTLVYQLDGSMSKNTLGANGMSVDLNSTATWSGDTLVIDTTAPQMQGGMKQVERWAVEGGGKMLTVRGDISVAGQSASAKMVFTKQ